MSKREVFELVKANGMLPALELAAKTFGKLHGVEITDINNNLIASYKNGTDSINGKSNASARSNHGSHTEPCASGSKSGQGRQSGASESGQSRTVYGSRRNGL